MIFEWEYTASWKKHFIDNDDYQRWGLFHLWEILRSDEQGEILSCYTIHQRKDGYLLYHKGKFIQHGKTVKELKQKVNET